jgi:hypothetical protein
VQDARDRERKLEKKAMLKMIMSKPEEDRIEEEQELYTTTIAAKKRKNARDRERKLEKKAMLEMIMSKPEEDRIKEEQGIAWIEEEQELYTTTIAAKKRKNARDRERKLEKKAMLEMVMSKREEDRIEEEQGIASL